MQESIGKRECLAVLARHRRDNVFQGYRGISDYHSGAYECDFVSPYTKSAQNLDADIMLVLQDWCSDEFLRKPVDPDVVKLGARSAVGHQQESQEPAFHSLWNRIGTNLRDKPVFRS